MLIFVLLLHAATSLQCGTTVAEPPSGDAPLARWPYITAVDVGTATITWGVNDELAVHGEVVWSAGGATHNVSAHGHADSWENWHDFPPLKTIKQFRAVLTDLPLGAVVCYHIVVDRKVVASGLQFGTHPGNTSTRTRFISWGDFGVGANEKPWLRPDIGEAKVRDAIWSKYDEADFLMALGDVTYFCGQKSEYDQKTFPYFYEQWAQKPLYLTPGNHDYTWDLAKSYLDIFAQHDNAWRADHKGRYYSFDWGLVHFVAVDTEWWRYDTPTSSDGMLAWLDADLTATTAPWTVVFMHKMPYTHGRLADVNVTTYIVPLLEKHSVPIVLGGHWHNYQRYPPVKGGNTSADGVTYVVSGGGGYAPSGTGDFVNDGKGGFRFIPGGAEQHHERGLGPKGSAPMPLVYDPTFHFCHWDITRCEARLQAINTTLGVIDDVVIKRC